MLFCVLILFGQNARSRTIIDSFIRTENEIDVDCDNLDAELISEIQDYKPIVDQIVHAAVHGPFSGAVWDR